MCLWRTLISINFSRHGVLYWNDGFEVHLKELDPNNDLGSYKDPSQQEDHANSESVIIRESML